VQLCRTDSGVRRICGVGQLFALCCVYRMRPFPPLAILLRQPLDIWYLDV